MKILVIIGECIRENSSANLCHLAYLEGLVSAGFEVHLLCAAEDGYEIDPAMRIPEAVHSYTYNGMSLYEKASLIKKHRQRSNYIFSAEKKPFVNSNSKVGNGKTIIKYLKRFTLMLYGPHGIYASFVRKAKRFRSSECFEYLISLSTPASSHLLAHLLLSSGHVKAEHWIQIWEDPWFSDVYGYSKEKMVYKEEKRLLNMAERVCYVSPVTLNNQKRLFSESAEKMFWEPVPAYYSYPEETAVSEKNWFGYFGDYSLPARNLMPFYNAANKCEINLTICGHSNINLNSTDKIQVHPRLPLEKLRPYEEKADILVFLCNQKGGQIPGKIYQYAATSKTILFILDGTTEEKKVIRDYFEPLNRFVFCDNTESDIEQAINNILSGNLTNVYNHSITEFEPEKIVIRILNKGTI